MVEGDPIQIAVGRRHMDFSFAAYFESKVIAERAGIDIDQASRHLDLRTLDLRRIPFGVEKVAG